MLNLLISGDPEPTHSGLLVPALAFLVELVPRWITVLRIYNNACFITCFICRLASANTLHSWDHFWTGIDSMSSGSELLRNDLANYQKASNLSLNEWIREQIANGVEIYHLAFGQSPFPVPKKLRRALQDNAERNEYLSIAGM